MLPVVSVEEMRAADATARRGVAESVLVRRAGTAVATAALALLGGGYGRRIVVLAGKGNNGADGRVAAARLSRRGAQVVTVEATETPRSLTACDLVIDAALGTGFRGSYDAPEPPDGAPVLAVDIPSGVQGDTGQAPGRPMRAACTVTFAAWKRGLLQGEGAFLSGDVVVADIGVPVESAGAALVDDGDVGTLLPRRGADAYKWETAVAIVAGSPGMEGAAALAARGAVRSGAGMVRLAVPGSEASSGGPWPLEVVRLPLSRVGWSDAVTEVLSRCRALVVGPGLGRDDATQAEVRRLLERTTIPTVVDADGLFALGEVRAPITTGGGQLVLTPHDGEYARLAGERPGADRIEAARRLAVRSGCVVLLKGSLTAIAPPGRRADDCVLLARAGSARLATAGTGDVLSGMIGAMLARGLETHPAAALAAHVHGRAAGLGYAEGLSAADLPDLAARWLSECGSR